VCSGDRAVRDQRDQDGDASGHRADDRDERTEEHQRGQRHGQRDSEDARTYSDPDAVHDGVATATVART
jgi:hypothetical protein